MEWSEEALVLSVRPQGESSARVMLLTRAQGRHGGLVRGGRIGHGRALLEPGSLVCARWRARLAEQLGSLRLDPVRSFSAGLLDDPLRLAALSAACALVDAGLPERAPHPALYDGLLALLETLHGTEEAVLWGGAYVAWEFGLLAELGFGLDLGCCAVSGVTHDLAYVSPRTGRAVSAAAAGEWADRLLPLPGFLCGQGEATAADVTAGLRLTGHFLERHLVAGLPPARHRLLARFQEWGGTAAP